MIRYSYSFLIDVAWSLKTLEECLRFLSLMVMLSHCYSSDELDKIRIVTEKRMVAIKKMRS
jgi:hypothetical protein